MLPLFESINRNIEEQRPSKTPVKDFTFKAYDSNYIDNLAIIITRPNYTNYMIFEEMEKNIDLLDGLFSTNSAANMLWFNNRFIELLLELFSEKMDNKYDKLRLFFIQNIDKVNIILANLLQNCTNEDFLIILYRLVEVIWDRVIAEIKEALGLDKWNAIPKRDWYITICNILGYSKTSNIPIVALNNLILSTILGDSVINVINLYYIFFGKEFSVVVLEDAFPSESDLLYGYSLYNKNNSNKSLGEANLDNLYIRSENLLKAAREIILSLTRSDLVKILRLIRINASLTHKSTLVHKIIDESNIRIATILMSEAQD